MRFNAPARFMEERDLLHHLVVAAPPSLLAAQGAPQEPSVGFSVWMVTPQSGRQGRACPGGPGAHLSAVQMFQGFGLRAQIPSRCGLRRRACSALGAGGGRVHRDLPTRLPQRLQPRLELCGGRQLRLPGLALPRRRGRSALLQGAPLLGITHSRLLLHLCFLDQMILDSTLARLGSLGRILLKFGGCLAELLFCAVHRLVYVFKT